jgi:predicted GNAT family acetyltransferase
LHDGNLEYEKLEETKEEQRKKFPLCQGWEDIAYFISFTEMRK